jgi:hypothetical protein
VRYSLASAARRSSREIVMHWTLPLLFSLLGADDEWQGESLLVLILTALVAVADLADGITAFGRIVPGGPCPDRLARSC